MGIAKILTLFLKSMLLRHSAGMQLIGSYNGKPKYLPLGQHDRQWRQQKRASLQRVFATGLGSTQLQVMWLSPFKDLFAILMLLLNYFCIFLHCFWTSVAEVTNSCGNPWRIRAGLSLKNTVKTRLLLYFNWSALATKHCTGETQSYKKAADRAVSNLLSIYSCGAWNISLSKPQS